MTCFGQFWKISNYDNSGAIWVLLREKIFSENNHSFLDEGAMVTSFLPTGIFPAIDKDILCLQKIYRKWHQLKKTNKGFKYFSKVINKLVTNLPSYKCENERFLCGGTSNNFGQTFFSHWRWKQLFNFNPTCTKQRQLATIPFTYVIAMATVTFLPTKFLCLNG